MQEPGWLNRSEPRGRAGRGLWGRSLRRGGLPRAPSGNGCSAGLWAPGAGKALVWLRSSRARDPAGGAAPFLPHWRWAEPGAEKRSRLQAPCLIFGWRQSEEEYGARRQRSGAGSRRGTGRWGVRALSLEPGGDGPRSRPLGVSLGLAASRLEDLAGAADGCTRPWEVCPCGSEGGLRGSEWRRCRGSGRGHRGLWGCRTLRPVDGWMGARAQ